MIIMGYQKVSDEMLERVKRYVEQQCKGRLARPGHNEYDVWSFNDALESLLLEAGF